jgi:2-oxoglutarate dehydrogenase E1 component
MRDRKPLIVFTPKSLLRSPAARSTRDELVSGSFEEVLDDPDAPNPDDVRRVVLCTGKVGIDLLTRKRELGLSNAAVVRIEQLYPFPHAALDAVFERYAGAELVWVQEEPENMGAWFFVFGKLQGHKRPIELTSREESGSPATGSKAIHKQEQEQLLDEAFDGLA